MIFLSPDEKSIPSGGKIFCVGREKVVRPDAEMKVGYGSVNFSHAPFFVFVNIFLIRVLNL